MRYLSLLVFICHSSFAINSSELINTDGTFVYNIDIMEERYSH